MHKIEIKHIETGQVVELDGAALGLMWALANKAARRRRDMAIEVAGQGDLGRAQFVSRIAGEMQAVADLIRSGMKEA